MVNSIWLALIVLGVVTGILSGTSAQVTRGIIEGANQAVNICLGFIGIMSLWSGLMRIAESAGLTRTLARFFAPLARWLFPSVPDDHPALCAITMSLVANLLGMGNAATPLGIKAMEELASLNEGRDAASDAMCTFVAISTAGITLIPTTVIAIRTHYRSLNPAEVVIPIVLMNILATSVALLADRFFRDIT